MKARVFWGLGIAAVSAIVVARAALTSPAPPNSFRFEAPRGWSESHAYSRMHTWVGDRSKKQFVSVLEDPSLHESPPWESDQALADDLKKAGEFPRWVAGIRDYEIEKIERFKLEHGGMRVTLIGRYRDVGGELIHFEEWKFYLDSGYSQINYSELGDMTELNRVATRELLQRYRPFGT